MATEYLTQPEVVAVELIPNPVAAGGMYTIAVTIDEVKLVAVIKPLFELPFSNDSLSDDLLELGEITYEKEQ